MNTGIAPAPHNWAKIEFDVVFSSTLTEEPGMPGGSVKTFVERRYPGRHELRLCTRQSVVVLIVSDKYL